MLGLYFFVYKREKPNKHLMYIAILMGKCYTKVTKDKTSYKCKQKPEQLNEKCRNHMTTGDSVILVCRNKLSETSWQMVQRPCIVLDK